MKKPGHKQPTLSKKAGILLGIAGAIVLLAGVLMIRSAVLVHADRARFAEAAKNEKMVFDQLVRRIGVTPLQIEEKNICYNSEQGPYDAGRLWCQIASAVYLVEPQQPTLVKTEFKEALHVAHIGASDNSSLEFESAHGIVCKLLSYDGSLATDPPYYFPTNGDARQTLALVCLDRARAKYYPYVAN